MKNTTSTIGSFVLFGALIATSCWALSLQKKLSNLEAQFAELRQARDAAVTEAQKALSDVAPLKENIARLKRERDSARASASTKVPDGKVHAGESPKTDNPADDFGGLLKQASSPEMHSFLSGKMATQARKEYAPLLKKWNLPQSEMELVVELMLDQNLGSVDYAKTHVNGKPLAPDELLASVEKFRQEANAKLKSVIGEQKFAELGAFNQGLKIDKVVGPYSEHLDVSGFPLTQEQKVNLANIISSEAAASRPIPPDSNGVIKSEALQKRDEDRQGRIIQQAKSFLSPDQISGLQSVFHKENEERQAASKLIDSILKSEDSDSSRNTEQKAR